MSDPVATAEKPPEDDSFDKPIYIANGTINPSMDDLCWALKSVANRIYDGGVVKASDEDSLLIFKAAGFDILRQGKVKLTLRTITTQVNHMILRAIQSYMEQDGLMEAYIDDEGQLEYRETELCIKLKGIPNAD